MFDFRAKCSYLALFNFKTEWYHQLRIDISIQCLDVKFYLVAQSKIPLTHWKQRELICILNLILHESMELLVVDHAAVNSLEYNNKTIYLINFFAWRNSPLGDVFFWPISFATLIMFMGFCREINYLSSLNTGTCNDEL